MGYSERKTSETKKRRDSSPAVGFQNIINVKSTHTDDYIT
jgi:hypothetical protein